MVDGIVGWDVEIGNFRDEVSGLGAINALSLFGAGSPSHNLTTALLYDSPPFHRHTSLLARSIQGSEKGFSSKRGKLGPFRA